MARKQIDRKSISLSKRANLIAVILAVAVFGTAVLLTTEVGRNILGIEVHPTASQAGEAKFRKVSNPVMGEYIVVFKGDPDETTASRNLAERYGGNVKEVYSYALNGYAANMTEEQARAVSDDPTVSFVEEVGNVILLTSQNDPQWGLDRIDQRSLPLNDSYNYTATGQGVHIYIIDSGVNVSHPEFGGRATQDFNASGDGSNTDCNGHGTAVAGVAGSSTYGVAKNSRLHSVKVMTCAGTGTTTTMISGINWVIGNRINPAVINMSLATVGAFTAVDNAVNNAINSGITFVAAAGNDSGSACNSSPARVANVITVAASTQSDQRRFNSNFGSCVDIFAPGDLIQTTTNGNSTDHFSGTSFASPNVAGVAALYLQQNPTASPGQVTNAILTTATTDLITNSGSGSPNLLVYSLLTVPVPADVTPPTVQITSPPNNWQMPAISNTKRLAINTTASDASGIHSIEIRFNNQLIRTCVGLTTCTADVSSSLVTITPSTITVTATDNATPRNTASTTHTISRIGRLPPQ